MSTVFVGTVVFGVARVVAEKASAAAAVRPTTSFTLCRTSRSDDGEEAVERLARVERAPVREAASHHGGGDEVRLPAGLERLGLLPEDREVVHLLARVDDIEAHVVAAG